jgi:hypothetical protein
LSEIETPGNESAVTALLILGAVTALFMIDGNLFYPATKMKVMIKMLGTVGKEHDCICTFSIYN